MLRQSVGPPSAKTLQPVGPALGSGVLNFPFLPSAGPAMPSTRLSGATLPWEASTQGDDPAGQQQALSQRAELQAHRRQLRSAAWREAQQRANGGGRHRAAVIFKQIRVATDPAAPQLAPHFPPLFPIITSAGVHTPGNYVSSKSFQF